MSKTKALPHSPSLARPVRTTFYDVHRAPVATTASTDPLKAVVRVVAHLQGGKYPKAVSAEVWNARTTDLYAAAVITSTEFHIYYNSPLLKRLRKSAIKETPQWIG